MVIFIATHFLIQATRLVTASEDDSSPIIMVWDLRNARAPEKARISSFIRVRTQTDHLYRSSLDMRKVSSRFHGVNKTPICFFHVAKTTARCAGIHRRPRLLERYKPIWFLCSFLIIIILLAPIGG